MLKNNGKMFIGKNILLCLFVICLMFTTFGFASENSFAVDLNNTVDNVGLESNNFDKLENSQNNESLEVESQDSDNVLGDSTKTYETIQNAIKSASAGATIKLSGTYVSTGSCIVIDRKVTITADSQATLNGKHLSIAFQIKAAAAGTVINNLKIINGEGDVGSGINVFAQNVMIKNCVFEDNHANKNGAVNTPGYLDIASGLTIDNCQFRRNTGYYKNFAGYSCGPAVTMYGKDSQIINSVFEDNWAKGTSDCFGGAIQIGLEQLGSNAKVTNCVFRNNQAISIGSRPSHGGAGCVRTGTVYTNCIFENNSADLGGALTFHSSGEIKNCTFIENNAGVYGGALSTGYESEYMELDVVDCNFIGNTAPNGGAVYAKGMNVLIKDSDFKNNNVTEKGGAVYVEADDVTITQCSFSLNQANVNGGAVYIEGQSTTVENSSFISNEAVPDTSKINDGLGGAIYIDSSLAVIKDNSFRLNTARNGSALYFDENGETLTLSNNEFYQNQAWVYQLPISAEDIYYQDTEQITVTLIGGNNIANYNNLAVSNAIYNAADNTNIVIDEEYPLTGARNDGHLYQDDREYNINVLLTVKHEDGTVVYNEVGFTDYKGEINLDLDNLKAGTYYVEAKHYTDNYYKQISNSTSFIVIPKVDNEIKQSVSKSVANYDDVVTWTITVTNHGPNNSTNVTVCDVLPQGLTWLDDTANGKYDHNTGILTIGDLNVDEVFTFNITSLISKTGEIVNNANVTASELDVNTTNNYAEETLYVNPSIDLEISKSVSNQQPNYRDHITWTIQITNNGPDTANDVEMTDVLPESLIYEDCDSDYDYISGVWKIASLDAGEKVTLNINCIVNATGLIENSARVNATEYDYDLTNNENSERITVDPASDLVIKKTVNASEVNLYDTVKWTLNITNYGPDTATDVVIIDLLPDGFTYINSTLTKGTFDEGCFIIDELNVNEEVIIEIITLVEETGDFLNYANVTSNEYDYNSTDNEDNETIHVNPACDLAVFKSISNQQPNYMDYVIWTIEVVNNGPDTAHDIEVHDVLSESLIYVESDGDYDAESGIWKISTLDVDESVELNIKCIVAATGSIENYAWANATEYDYDLTNNNDSEKIQVPPASDLSIEKSVNVSTANYLDVVKWTLTISNNGPDSATNVKVYETLPEGFKYISSSIEYNNGSFSIDKINADEKVTIEIITLVEATGNFVNYAGVTGDEYDYNITNNQDNETVFINPASDVSVKKYVKNMTVNYNDIITWTIEVSNSGPDTAHNITVTDILSDSLIWTSDDSSDKYNPETGVLKLDELKVNETYTFNINCIVNRTGDIVNNVSVTVDEYDYNITNNFDNETVNIKKAADVSVIKLANNSAPHYNDLVKWTLIIYNNGPDNATNVYIEDQLPEGLILINYTATKGIYDQGVWAMCCLKNGETETLEIICRVNKTRNITNAASIHIDEYDYSPDNNNDSETIYVPLAADIEITVETNNTNPLFGEEVTWMIAVKNNGPDNASGVYLEDILPEEVLFSNYLSTGFNYENNLGAIGVLNVGETVYLNITTVSNDLGLIKNNATVDLNEYDWKLSNNYAEDIIDVQPVADISITKSADKTSPNYGETVKWTITVTNKGPNNATNVTVEDILPDGLTFKKSSGNYRNNIWKVGTLNAGETKQIEIVTKVTSTGTLTNTANVNLNEYDPNTTNNQAQESISVPPASDLSVTKIASKYHYKSGEVIEYVIEIVNNGPDTARNIKVNEILDGLLKLKSFKVTKGKFNKLTNVWSIKSLGYGESAKLYIKAIALGSGIIKNTVKVTSDTFDPDESNNMDFAVVNVSKPLDNKSKSPEKHPHKKSLSNLEMHPTANPFFILMIAVMISVIFSGRSISKKR